MTAMYQLIQYQLIQLAADRRHQRLAAAEQRRPAQRALALARAIRRAAGQARHRSMITGQPSPIPSPSDHKEVTMTRIRRIFTALATLTGALLALAAAAPAALAVRVPPPGDTSGTVQPPQVHTVVAGGMPGWQIALIAAGAALVAAVLAVIADRARAARRRQMAGAA
jgi:hypothetical protein